MHSKKTSKAIAGLALIVGCLALPVGASALFIGQLGPAPMYISTTAAGTDFGSGSNKAPYYGWWNTLGIGLCVGRATVSCRANVSQSAVGNYKAFAQASCSNGGGVTSPAAGWTVNQSRSLALCPIGTFSTWGVFGVDSFPYGS